MTLDLAESGDAGHGMLWMIEALKRPTEDQPGFEEMIRRNLSGWRQLFELDAARRVSSPPRDEWGNLNTNIAIHPSHTLSGRWEPLSRPFAQLRPTNPAKSETSQFDGDILFAEIRRSGSEPVQYSAEGGTLLHRDVFWNTETGQPDAPDILTEDNAIALVFSPDGKRLAVGISTNRYRYNEVLTLHLSAGFRMLVDMKSQDTNIESLTIGSLARRARVGVPAPFLTEADAHCLQLEADRHGTRRREAKASAEGFRVWRVLVPGRRRRQAERGRSRHHCRTIRTADSSEDPIAASQS